MSKPEFDCDSSSDVVCPYCGNEYQADGSESEGNQTCDSCGKLFALSIDYSTTYSTSKLCEENGTEHDFQDWATYQTQSGPVDGRFCRGCGKCETR